MRQRKKTRIMVVSGPSGAGKTTLLKRLFLRKTVRENFVRSVSYTTRTPRPGEQAGKDYFFVDRGQFLRLKNKRFFLESERVLEAYYGTPRDVLDSAGRKGKDVILCIDVKGGMYLKKKLGAAVTTIFITAPDRRDLYKRLKKRAEQKTTIQKRIQLAKKELQSIKDYDYLIINQNLKEALCLLESVLVAERLRRNPGR